MIDFPDLRSFYQTQLGLLTQAVLRASTGILRFDFQGARLLPLGCADLLLGAAPVVSARMTAPEGETFACLVDMKNKPLPDADIDGVVALHAAKDFFETELLLREVWRVLKGEGRFLLIVPRRRSAWAENMDTPFGMECAFSAPHIKKILKAQGFVITSLRSALYAPPGKQSKPFLFALGIEKIAPYVPFYHGGVLVIDAQKRVLSAVGAKKQNLQAGAAPLLASPLPI